MAFFQFRWPGQKGQDDKPTPVRPSRAAVAAESIESMRRRARHRLMGAAVLVLVGVIGFPLLFDSQPRPVPVDIPIQIPDRDRVAALTAPEPVAPAGPQASAPPQEAAPKPSAAPAPAPPPAAVPPAAPAPAAPPVAASAPAPSAARPAAAPAFVPAPAQRAEPRAPAEPARASGTSDADRARALLEGRSVDKPAAAHGGERFIAQIGAYAEADKAREVRVKLERAGIKTYTQVVETREGKRIRVRVGPFEGRAEADKAAARIKGLGLPVSILQL